MLFDWRIGLIVLLGIALFIGVNSLMQKKSRRISPARLTAQNAIVGAILEYVQGMSVVRSLNLASDVNKTLNESISECEKQNIKLELCFIPFIFLQTMDLKFVSVVLIIYSIIFYLNGTMELFICITMVISAFLIYSQLETGGIMSALLRLIEASIDQVMKS